MSVTGAEYDEDTGLLKMTQENYGKLQSLYFEISDVRLCCSLIPEHV